MANCASSSSCEATNVLFAQRHCSYFTGDEYDNLSDFEDVMFKKIGRKAATDMQCPRPVSFWTAEGHYSRVLLTDSDEEHSQLQPFKTYPPPPECQNGGVWSDTTKTSCDCTGSFAGTYCERYWDDCSEGFKMGITAGGVHTIQPRPFATPFQVYCDMRFGGRTYVQKQSLGIDFYRTWQEYRDGFGTPGGDFWLGLEKMKAISDKTPGRLIINMLYKKGQPTWGQIICHSFKLTDELDGFRLNFSHTAASKNPINDVITDLRGARFSTKDRDHDEDPAGSCSQKHHSGWWFRSCTLCNPNGQLKPIPNIATNPDDIFWDGDKRGVKETYIALSGY
ncbi:angiopoietin-2-like [Haliotis rufescens]|uniref:angiopoietin-2-like n=1 Tax=Haliotis rufescens TaxID=6454 RepID=UPI00201F86D3|nr:angiopoietin-2-like [Haliotis rufescens]